MFARAVADSERVVLFERLNGKRQPIYDVQGQQTGTIWVEELVPPIPELAEAAKALAPFPVPKVQVNVYQFWPFKPSAGDAPTIPSAALQVHALSVQPRWMELLERAGARGIEDVPRTSDGVGRAAAVKQLMQTLRRAFVNDPGLSARLREQLAGDWAQQVLTNDERRLLAALTVLYAGADNRYLNFYGPPGSIPNIPYNAILGSEVARIPAGGVDLAGKVVFVGLSDLYDPGQPDRFYTVVTNEHGVDLSGVEIAATAFANMLTNRSLTAGRSDGDGCHPVFDRFGAGSRYLSAVCQYRSPASAAVDRPVCGGCPVDLQRARCVAAAGDAGAGATADRPVRRPAGPVPDGGACA